MPDQRPPAPHESWTVERWEAYRKVVADYLATDPGWKVGPAVLAGCDRHISRARASR